MAELVQNDRLIRAKIVYYGPALGGKTSSLRELHRRAAEDRRGKLLSLNSLQDRTILFDLLPLRALGPRGYEISLQLFAVPGQALYAATRRTVLKGVDGIVFVANSAEDRMEENCASLRELERHLMDQGIDPLEIPLVMQYNKRDLPRVMAIEAMDGRLRKRSERSFPSVATRGEGVIEAFQAVLGRTIADLARRYRVLQMAPGSSPEDWARRAVLRVFGTADAPKGGAETLAPTSASDFGVPVELSASGEGPGNASAVQTIRVSAPKPCHEVSTGNAPAPTSRLLTVEAYAEACAQMAGLLSETTLQMDEARRRFEDVRRASTISAQAAPGDFERLARRALSTLAEAAGAAQGSLALPGDPGAAFVGLTLSPLECDPLMITPSGQAWLRRAGLKRPFVQEAADDLDLLALLAPLSFSAVAVVPIGPAEAPLALALLYFTHGDRLPDAVALEHVGLLGSLFTAPFVLAGAQLAGPRRAAAGARPTEVRPA